MKKLNIATAIKRYNNLIDEVYCEDAMRIGGTNTEGWNMRDMVSEIQYHIDCHYEYGHAYYESIHEGEDYEPGDRYYEESIKQRNEALKRLARFKRFVKAYEPFIKEMKCKERHCSKWDN